ncbi:MAG: hypothetical protein MSIBF_05705 [Candidatus Altiarchaeales archaeon IMC4]|nr:MAG: hypothetical protein MSIBF_05705 [Candidatus Altiarchaeales archaeon IMC4]
MASELRRKLIEYRIVDERFRQEYGMGFDEFKKKNIVGRQKHSFNVESDFCDWELAVDGIGTINKELKRILK